MNLEQYFMIVEIPFLNTGEYIAFLIIHLRYQTVSIIILEYYFLNYYFFRVKRIIGTYLIIE